MQNYIIIEQIPLGWGKFLDKYWFFRNAVKLHCLYKV